MADILWTRQAQEDLDAVPDRIVDRVLRKIELLAEFPHMGSPMDGPYEGFRQLLVGRYRVIYQVVDSQVRLAYIRHGARQLTLRLIAGEED